MIVSWNWLTEYVRLDMPVELLTERLALTGMNHESTKEVDGDFAIDLEVTSNRSDCLSHIGVAREIAVIFGGRSLHEPDPRPTESGGPIASSASVGIEAPELCTRFTARVVRGIRIGPSPWWMQRRLETIGVRPISNVVDITNYVMFECGQPLHAYDLDRLRGNRLLVRHARRGERLQAINAKTYELDPEMLVIADAERPVGLAGVMGGLDTEIGPSTKDVLIESALFDAMSVRRTARALGLFSPSSYRFERAMDAERTEWASRRCAQLIVELAGGTLDEGLIDLGDWRRERHSVSLRDAQIARTLGIEIPRDRCIEILSSLGLELLDRTESSTTWRPPSWRSDLEREIDLIEEVARIHGYEHIPEDRPVPLTRSSRGLRERVESEIRSTLTGLGFDEAYTFSLVPDELVFPLDAEGIAVPLRVDHSSRKREANLRPSLAPSLIAARGYNQAHGTPDASFFEIAPVYLPRKGQQLPDEPTRLAFVSGHDYFGLKAVVECLLDRLHAPQSLEARSFDHDFFQSGRAAEFLLGETLLGQVGEVRRECLEALGVRGQASIAELDLHVLLEHANLIPQYTPLPSHPSVHRDLSMVVPTSLRWSELAAVVRHSGGSTLAEVEFLDTYQGSDLPPDRHSLHFGLTFRHRERTLTSAEVDSVIREIVRSCEARFGATLRA